MVFKVKRNGVYHARLVAKGFSQIPGVEFTDNYSPVVNDVTFRHTASESDLYRATNASLMFNNQKNREWAEVIGHARIGHSTACLVYALSCQCIALRRAGGTASTPLCTYHHGTQRATLSSNDLTTLLHNSTHALPGLGFMAPDINGHSLQAGGTMALLCGKVNADTIRLVGQLKLDAMFRYLHAHALPLIRDLAATMLSHHTLLESSCKSHAPDLHSERHCQYLPLSPSYFQLSFLPPLL